MKGKGRRECAELGQQKGRPPLGNRPHLLSCQVVSLFRIGTKAPGTRPLLARVFRCSFSFARFEGHSMAMASGAPAELKCPLFSVLRAISSHAESFTFACSIEIAGRYFYQVRFHVIGKTGSSPAQWPEQAPCCRASNKKTQFPAKETQRTKSNPRQTEPRMLAYRLEYVCGCSLQSFLEDVCVFFRVARWPSQGRESVLVFVIRAECVHAHAVNFV